MTNEKLKKLAKLTVRLKVIDPKLSYFVLRKLPRKNLIFYLRYLKKLLDQDTVRILSATKLNAGLRRIIERKYREKNVIFVQDRVGDGIKVVINDTIIDLTVKGFIDQTMHKLKSEI